MAVFFGGKFLIQPQASVQVDDSQLQNLNPGANNILALVGPSTGGIPQTPTLISDPTSARRYLLGGDLLNAALLAFDPSSQTGGATKIYLVRVNSAVQASGKILDVAAPAKASGTLTLGGTVHAGDVYTATINGVAITYTATGSESGISTIAADLTTNINASTNVAISDPVNGVVASVSSSVITITARYGGVDGNAITLVASVGGTSPQGTMLASGATLTNGTGNTLATLKSKDYGLYTNQINFQFSAGSTTGTKVVIALTQTTSVVGINNLLGGSITQDNLVRQLLTVQYTGAGSACSLTVNDTSLATTVTGAAQDNLNISFAQYTTIQQVHDIIAATGVYSVSIVNLNYATYPSASQFDPLTNQSIMTATTLNGNLQAIIDFLNSNASIYMSATRTVNPKSATPGYSAAPLYLVGGSDGTTSTVDFANSFLALQAVVCDIVVPITNLAANHAAAAAHCAFMSGQGGSGRSPRVAICGGALGEYNATSANPTSTITARAAALNSDRVMLVSPGISYYDYTGTLQVADSSFTAAMVGGMAASVNPGIPLTHKYLSNLVSLEVAFTPSDLDSLLLGGVAPLQFILNKGFRIVQSRTTWLANSNYAHVEFSTRRAIDAVVVRVQNALDDNLVGTVLSPVTLAQAVSMTETVLIQAQNDGLIVGNTASPAYRNISASTPGGDVIYVSFEISPAIPTNYVLCNVSLTAFAGTVGSTSSSGIIGTVQG